MILPHLCASPHPSRHPKPLKKHDEKNGPGDGLSHHGVMDERWSCDEKGKRKNTIFDKEIEILSTEINFCDGFPKVEPNY
ncbi:hypothetical protein ABMY26_06225 (plasmid) [Azospirillum sp. HJ39]|uniref:hypothetical protein n=1 Tax=Azospirillum sp. HJ39 TaxID=3159496 RepID=UPI0035560CDC